MSRFAIPAAVSAAMISAAVLPLAGSSADASPTPEPAAIDAQFVATESGSDTAAGTDTSEAAAVSSTQNLTYGGSLRNILDVYTPAVVAAAPRGTALTPTVVLVHGGSWTHGDKTSMTRAANALVGEGYVAIAVNYTFVDSEGWPAQRQDVRKAIRWIQDNAEELHVDVERLVVLGSSAGGEIAASALTKGNGSKYGRGLVMLSAPVDLAVVAAATTGTKGARDLARTVKRKLVDCRGLSSKACTKLLTKRSALSRLDERDVPSLLIAAKREWVDPQSSKNFRKAAKKAGLKSKLVMVSGSAHGLNNWDKAWPAVREWIADRMAARS